MRKAIVILVTLFITSSCSINTEIQQNESTTTPAPVTETEQPDTNQDYTEKTVNGVRVFFHPQTSTLTNNRLISSIDRSVSMLPDHMKEVIREVTIYAVRRAEKCPTIVGTNRVAGCADGVNSEWIELIGYQSPAVILHEFGHIIGNMKTNRGTTIYSMFFANVYSEEPVGPTNYSRRYYIEDFAETFSIYILAPHVLKEGYPIRYEFFRNLFEDKL
ncbi:MAG: hypothetical protein R3346_01740 [Candidatus Spechtbacterales bacterium]|nr:hypothetical protein [Candidatus Spechtbacterales bacterium]